jgi:hypothetical protein
MGLISPDSARGPLQADASGGGTSVFVNGRELHPYDVMALRQLRAHRAGVTLHHVAGRAG